MSRHAMPEPCRVMPCRDVSGQCHAVPYGMPGNGHGWTGEQVRSLGLTVQIMEAVLWDEAVMI